MRDKNLSERNCRIIIHYHALPASVGIVGSRVWPDHHEVEDAVHKLVAKFPKTVRIVSGGALGVDKWAKEAALFNNLSYHEIPVDEERVEYYKIEKRLSGRAAFRRAAFDRNKQIVQAVKQDDGIVFAFNNLDSVTKGTENTIEWCDDLHVPCVIFERSEEHNWQSMINQAIILNKRHEKIIQWKT